MVLDDAQFDIGSKLLPELFVVLIICNLLDHVQSLTDQLLADDLWSQEKLFFNQTSFAFSFKDCRDCNGL